MAQMVDFNLKPDDRILRQFGFIAVVGFGFLAAMAWFDWLIFARFPLGEARETVAMVLMGIGALSGFLSIVFPKGNIPIYLALSVIAFPIGFVLSYLILGILFYGMIAPMGFLLRLVGRDPLNRKLLPEAETYWVDSRPPRPKESYFKQF